MPSHARTARAQTYLVQGAGDGIAGGLANGDVDLRSSKAGEKGGDGGVGEHVEDWDYAIESGE